MLDRHHNRNLGGDRKFKEMKIRHLNGQWKSKEIAELPCEKNSLRRGKSGETQTCRQAGKKQEHLEQEEGAWSGASGPVGFLAGPRWRSVLRVWEGTGQW